MLACAITTGDDHCQWLSPISNLLRIGQLPLLQALYGSVVIPESVYAEIRALESFGIDTSWLVDTEWIAILPVGDQAIALAIELKADRLLMDERLGRQVAQRFSLRVTGLLGVLVAAKQDKLIAELKPVLDDLMAQAKFWVHPELYRQILQDVNEGD